jgi:ABC-type glycerol-3-phosphate transport system substrate-binding protein
MKRLIYAILAAILTAGIFAGCSGDSGKGGDRSFTYLRPTWGAATYYKGGPYEAELKRQTGVTVDVQIVPAANYNEKSKTVISTGDIPDLIWGQPPSEKFYADTIEQGAFLNISPYLEEYPAIREAVPEAIWKRLTNEKGEIYFIPKVINPYAEFFIFYRKDWFDKAGIKEPENVAEFETALEIIKNGDYDGNGKKDTIPMTFPMLWYAKDLATSYDAVVDSWQPSKEDNAKVVPWFTLDSAPNFQFWMQKLHKNGLMDPDYIFVSNAQQIKDKFAAGKAAVLIDIGTQYINYVKKLKDTNPDAVVGIMPPLKGPDGLQTGTRMADPIDRGIYVSAQTAKADVIFEYINWQVTEGHDYMMSGVEGKTYTILPNGRKKTIPDDQRETDYKQSQIEPLQTIGVYSVDTVINWETVAQNFEDQGLLELFDYYKERFVQYGSVRFYDYRNPEKPSAEETRNYQRLYNEYIKEVFEAIPVKYDITPAVWQERLQKWLDNGGQAIIDDVNKVQKGFVPSDIE